MRRISLFILLGLLALSTLAIARPKPKKLVKVWETDSTLSVPESVLYDQSSNILYVSNIEGKSDALDGNGFISKLTLDGKIETLRWASGLNAPKGMALYRNMLYVTDVYRLVAINTATGQAEKTWDAIKQDGAFLNDATVDKTGTVYVSDNRNDKIYRLKDDKWEVWMEGDQLKSPNGLLAVGTDKLLIGSSKIGALQSVDVATKVITKVADGMDRTDGIVQDKKGNTFVSDWIGQVFVVNGSDRQQLLDTRAEKINAADIEYVRAGKLIVVPTFFKNKVVAYRVTQ